MDAEEVTAATETAQPNLLSASAVAEQLSGLDRDGWQLLIDGLLARPPDEQLINELITLADRDAVLTEFTAALVWQVIAQGHYQGLSKPAVQAALTFLRGSYFDWLPPELHVLIASMLPYEHVVRLDRADVHAHTDSYLATRKIERSRYEGAHLRRYAWDELTSHVWFLGETVKEEPDGFRKLCEQHCPSLLAMFDQFRDDVPPTCNEFARSLENASIVGDIVRAAAILATHVYGAIYALLVELSMTADVPLVVRMHANTLAKKSKLVMLGAFEATKSYDSLWVPDADPDAALATSRILVLADQVETTLGALMTGSTERTKPELQANNQRLLRKSISEAQRREHRSSHDGEPNKHRMPRVPVVLSYSIWSDLVVFSTAASHVGGWTRIEVYPPEVEHRRFMSKKVIRPLRVIVCGGSSMAKETVDAILSEHGLPECEMQPAPVFRKDLTDSPFEF